MSEYKNRYGDVFSFEQLENGNIQWSGDFKYVRCGFKEDPNDPHMVDPSGGPYIAEGMDMSLFGVEGIVKGFKDNDSGYEIIVK